MRYCTKCGDPLEGNIRCDNCLVFDNKRFNDVIEEYYENKDLSDEENPLYTHLDTFKDKIKLLYPRLEKSAIDGTRIPYDTITGNGIGVFRRGYYLGGVGVVEHHDNRPLLPSVVVQTERGALTNPGEGYYKLAHYLYDDLDQIPLGNEEKKKSWWRSNLNEVHAFWEKRDYKPPNIY